MASVVALCLKRTPKAENRREIFTVVGGLRFSFFVLLSFCLFVFLSYRFYCYSYDSKCVSCFVVKQVEA